MRAVVRPDRFIGDAELERIGDENPGWRVERIDGGVTMSPTSPSSGPVMMRVSYELAAWAERHNYVGQGADTGVLFPNNDVLAHDGALIARHRWVDIPPSGYAPLMPDVVVEVASRSDRRSRLREKCERWHREGSRFVVMLDPADASVTTWGDPPKGMDIDWHALAAYKP